MRKRIISVFFIVFLISVSFTSCKKIVKNKNADYLFEITMLKTGKSDSIILESQGKTVLIDVSDRDSARKITRYLNSRGIKELECVIISHFDSDHIGGFETVSDRLHIKNIIQPNYKEDTEVYKKYVEKLGEKNINVITADKNLSFLVNDLEFKIYTTNTEFENKNNRSLMTAVSHGEKKFLFAGDAETERCNEILQKEIDSYDFLKVPHHGIYFKSAEELYGKVSPKIAAITDDENIDTAKTEDILRRLNCNVFHTKNGMIKIVSNGSEIKAVQE